MWKVYYAVATPLLDEKLFQKMLPGVDKKRQEKALQYKQQADRARSLAAGVLLQKVQAEFGLLIEDGRTLLETPTVGEHGKIKYSNQYDINLSHAGDYAVVAVADCDIGVDVEVLKNRFDTESGKLSLERIMKHSFTGEEIAYVDGQADRFVYIWTRKEAYAKSCGRGITMDFKTIDTLREDRYYSQKIKENYWLSVFSKEQQTQKPMIVEVDLCMMN